MEKFHILRLIVHIIGKSNRIFKGLSNTKAQIYLIVPNRSIIRL